MKRLLIAAAFLLGLCAYVTAQVPPPVPALPDTARIAQYSAGTATTGPFSLGFAVFGDDGDPQNWVQVWVNSVLQPTTAWTFSSASGAPISIQARPISDGQITFAQAVSGTVQILGARRPRRVSQFTENRGVAARDLNQAISDSIAMLRERWDYDARAIVGLPGETLNTLPTTAVRAGQILGFDVNGQPITYIPALISPAAVTCTVNNWISTVSAGGLPSCSGIGAGSVAFSMLSANVPQLAGVTALGGRLTLQSGKPVMTTSQTSQTVVYYAPFSGPFISIYDGTNTLPHQFTVATTDVIGPSITLGSNWLNGTLYDVYLTLIGGTPTMCTQAWTNSTTRATALALFNGVQTNAATIPSCRFSNILQVSVNANQGTYVGTFLTSASGQVSYTLGGAASGGSPGFLGLCNYYNREPAFASSQDTGTGYTYLTAVVRQARASVGNQITFVQCATDDATVASYQATGQLAASGGAFMNMGIGIDASTAFALGGASLCTFQTPSASAITHSCNSNFSGLLAAGSHVLYAVEQGDNGHANTFDTTSTNMLLLNKAM